MKQLLLDIQAPAQASFDNFVVGKNSEALYSLKHILSGHSEQRFIYLWGLTGSGKSHLIQAAQAWISQSQSASDTPLVCADDVDQLDEEAQIALFNTYNQLRAEGGILIATGAAAPSQMQLRDDLATRLAWGLVYQLHPLSDEEKAQALQNHAQARGMKLPKEVVDYCLRHLRRDLPSLIATISALDEWSLTYKRTVTIPLLKQLLRLE